MYTCMCLHIYVPQIHSYHGCCLWDSDEADAGKEVVTSDEEEEETPKEKQLRLAKKYLEELSATG